MPQPVSERVKKSRQRRKKAGLRRVEVFVPEDKVDLLKAYAAQLREDSESEVLVKARALIAEAFRKYRASCLDNISIEPDSADLADAAIVAAALMNRGNAEAYRLGKQLRSLAK